MGGLSAEQAGLAAAFDGQGPYRKGDIQKTFFIRNTKKRGQRPLEAAGEHAMTRAAGRIALRVTTGQRGGYLCSNCIFANYSPACAW